MADHWENEGGTILNFIQCPQCGENMRTCGHVASPNPAWGIRRPTWDEWGLQLAKAVALRADCTRRQVGAVLMRADHTIVSTGYNGAASKAGSCLGGDCPRGRMSKEEVLPTSSYDSGAGLCIALHAEQNALLRASWDDMQGSTLYITDKPCVGCERTISGTPIERVVYP